MTDMPKAHESHRSLDALAVPLTPAVVPRLLPPLAAALKGGPAVLPLPEGPPAVQAEVLHALRPSEPVENPDPDNPVALVVPTSGTTGEPKGVLLSARALTASARATHDRLAGPGRWLLATPATHIGGLMVLVRSIVAGTEPVAVDLTGGFDPERFAAASMRVLSNGGPRYTAIVPTQLARLLDAGGAAVDALAAFDAVLVGGGATPVDLLERARAADVAVVTTYGMTETSGGCVYDGYPLEGLRADIAADGRIRLAGPVLASGYRLRPDLTAAAFADGWFRTSDVGRLAADGRLTVVGRVDDIVVSGGTNVPLAAVEAHVQAHPAVSEAAAAGVTDPLWGQRVVAVVVPADPSLPPTLDSVRAFVARRAPAAYAPRELVVVERLPYLGNGKIDRKQIERDLGARG